MSIPVTSEADHERSRIARATPSVLPGGEGAAGEREGRTRRPDPGDVAEKTGMPAARPSAAILTAGQAGRFVNDRAPDCQRDAPPWLTIEAFEATRRRARPGWP